MADPASDRGATFDKLFADGTDPWDLETSDYERSKREHTLAALGPRRFARGLEVGCATGMLTAELAGICDNLLAIDVSEVALKRARERLQTNSRVIFENRDVGTDWPSGSFELIVFSEVLYFLSEREIEQTSQAAFASLRTDGVCLLVNWTGSNDLPINGDTAAQIFGHHSNWLIVDAIASSSYRIDLFKKPRVLQIHN